MTTSASSPGPHETPLAQVLDEYDQRGFTGQFAPVDGGQLRCLTCRTTFPATDVVADEVRRIEGASDPADMAAVVPLHCPSCGAAGTFIANYGPDAGPEESDVLIALDRDPAQDNSPSR
jgi:hypothetical protein